MSLIHSAKRAIQRKGVSVLKKMIAYRRKKYTKKETARNPRFKTASEESYELYGRGFIERFKAVEFSSKKGTFTVGKTKKFIPESSQALTVECKIEEGQTSDFSNLTDLKAVLKNSKPRIATVSLGFEKGTVIIESIQENKMQKTLRNEFWRITKKRPVELLLSEVEATAKRLGFKSIRIRRPETLHYYMYPINDNYKIDYSQRKQEVQAGMRTTYSRIANKFGYAKGEFFYTKAL